MSILELSKSSITVQPSLYSLLFFWFFWVDNFTKLYTTFYTRTSFSVYRSRYCYLFASISKSLLNFLLFTFPVFSKPFNYLQCLCYPLFVLFNSLIVEVLLLLPYPIEFNTTALSTRTWLICEVRGLDLGQ